MYYHFAILLLFRPLIKLRIIGSAILPRDVCSQAADAIQGLLRSYSQLYTLRRTPSFVPYFLLASSIMHLAIGASIIESSSSAAGSSASTTRPDHPISSSQSASSPTAGSAPESASSPLSPVTTTKLSPKVSAAIKQGIADLAEMAPCHHFAEQALNILRFLAKKWNIDVDVPYKGIQEEFDKLVRPSTDSLNFFIPHVSAEDFMSKPERKRQRAASRSRSRHVDAERMEGVVTEETHSQQHAGPLPGIELGTVSCGMAENPLFWPFPMQGRPMLPVGHQLEEAGFALL
ncbi:putative nitrate assimilation regulatory protein nirA [Rosellinia necatrix]|uniref:Putative nitrate assimilation regulatory protein nirA n=1 Tax=Rosellinia necatrix TaxID=77044 RepID=A0A1S8A7I4_ROSNE|nr:putative nitrate assimilation regulatory protein nirA [Rosellinia necatrix]